MRELYIESEIQYLLMISGLALGCTDPRGGMGIDSANNGIMS
jgi:hypothetical protein